MNNYRTQSRSYLINSTAAAEASGDLSYSKLINHRASPQSTGALRGEADFFRREGKIAY